MTKYHKQQQGVISRLLTRLDLGAAAGDDDKPKPSVGFHDAINLTRSSTAHVRPKMGRQLSQINNLMRQDSAKQDEEQSSDEKLVENLRKILEDQYLPDLLYSVCSKHKVTEHAVHVAEQLKKHDLCNVDKLVKELEDYRFEHQNQMRLPEASQSESPDMRKWLEEPAKKGKTAFLEFAAGRLRTKLGLHDDRKVYRKVSESLLRAAVGHYMLKREAQDRVRHAYSRVITNDMLKERSFLDKLTQGGTMIVLLVFYVFGNFIPSFPWCILPFIAGCLKGDDHQTCRFRCLTSIDFIEPFGFTIIAAIFVVMLHVYGYDEFIEDKCPRSVIFDGHVCAAEYAYVGWALSMTILKSADLLYEIFVEGKHSSQLSVWLLQIFNVKVPTAMLHETKLWDTFGSIDMWLFVVISMMVAYIFNFVASWFLYPNEVVLCEPKYLQTNASDPDPDTRCPAPYYFPLLNDPSSCCRFVDQSFDLDVLISRAGGAAVSAYVIVRGLARLLFEYDPIMKTAMTRNRRDTDQRLADSWLSQKASFIDLEAGDGGGKCSVQPVLQRQATAGRQRMSVRFSQRCDAATAPADAPTTPSETTNRRSSRRASQGGGGMLQFFQKRASPRYKQQAPANRPFKRGFSRGKSMTSCTTATVVSENI